MAAGRDSGFELSHFCHSLNDKPLPAMIDRMVPSGNTFPLCCATITCFDVSGCRHFWWLPDWPTSANPCRFKTSVTWWAVRRGVPRSPNSDLVELRIARKLQIGRRQVEFDGLSDVLLCLLFRIAC